MEGVLLPKELVGQKIREIRKRLGQSQREFAVALGRPETDQGAVSEWERGESYPPGNTLAGIARLGGVSPSEFTRETDEGDREREEMLIAAKWFEIQAGELRERANQSGAETGPPPALGKAEKHRRRKKHGPEDPSGTDRKEGAG